MFLDGRGRGGQEMQTEWKELRQQEIVVAAPPVKTEHQSQQLHAIIFTTTATWTHGHILGNEHDHAADNEKCPKDKDNKKLGKPTW